MASENPKPPLRRSRYRTVLNICMVSWFVICGLLLLFGIVMIVVAALALNHGEPEKSAEHWGMIKLGAACGAVNIAIMLYGRKYFRRAYERITELERLERRGP